MSLSFIEKMFLLENSAFKLHYLQMKRSGSEKTDRNEEDTNKKKMKIPYPVQELNTGEDNSVKLKRTYPVQNHMSETKETCGENLGLQQPTTQVTEINEMQRTTDIPHHSSDVQEVSELQKTFGIQNLHAVTNEPDEFQELFPMEIPSISYEVLGKFLQQIKILRQDSVKFQDFFKVSISTFDYILRLVYPKIQPKSTNMVQYPVSAEERLGITLRFLGTGTRMRQLALAHGYGSSTVKLMVTNTLQALWECLQPLHMKRPTKQSFLKISHDFNKLWKFPNMVGAIHGKHIRVKWSSYASKSMVLQAAVDAHYKFILIDVWSDSVQVNAGVFRNSDLFQLIDNELLDIPQDSELPSSTAVVPFVFLGNWAYPLLKHLLRPYGIRQTEEDKLHFNQRLENARKVTNTAFDILFNKWKILDTAIETKPNLAERIVKGICVLHNTIIDLEGVGSFHPDGHKYLMDIETDISNNKSSAVARNIRNIFKSHLCSSRDVDVKHT